MFEKIKLEKSAEIQRDYPRINLTEKELPALKKWELGKEHAITLKVKLISIRKEEGMPLTATLQVMAVDGKAGLSKEQQEIMDKMMKYES